MTSPGKKASRLRDWFGKLRASRAGAAGSGGVVIDKELIEYRDLVEQPTHFSEGFTWVTVLGAVFCGLIMFPGAIYLGLLSGMSMTGAATWVTLIVFSEITRRALKSMSRAEMVILLMVAGAMISGGPLAGMIWRQFLVTSDAVKDVGLYGRFPAWFAPSPDSAALTGRTFMHWDWALPIALLGFTTIIGFLQQWTLGYALFRLTSDVEKLPFPMAPVGAQGITALAEGEGGQKTWRWTAFSTGTVLGLAFGVISVGVPAVSSAFLEKPITILPIPWFDLTGVTESAIPATPMGIIVDLGILLGGFVIPFWAVVGTAIAALASIVLNPILHRLGVLSSWRPGMDTVSTSVSNSVDFYFSFTIGVALGVAAVSLYQTARQIRVSLAELKQTRLARAVGSLWDTPEGRGDWSLKLCFVIYFASALAVVAACKILVPQFPVVFLCLFAFVYTPLASYLNARVQGIAAASVEIPYVREGFILLSGARGVAPWLAPLPVENYGSMALQLRTTELTGTRLRSLLKAGLLTTPLVFILSFVFWSALWRQAPIPSDMYPYAQKMWDLQAKNQMILWSATGTDPNVPKDRAASVTLFDRSFHPGYIGAGAAVSVGLFVALSGLGLPTMLVYGIARGLGMMPHGVILELVGALIARFYFQRRFGKKPFLQFAPIVLAGYFVGTGLIGMGAVAIRLIASAISQSPF